MNNSCLFLSSIHQKINTPAQSIVFGIVLFCLSACGFDTTDETQPESLLSIDLAIQVDDSLSSTLDPHTIESFRRGARDVPAETDYHFRQSFTLVDEQNRRHVVQIYWFQTNSALNQWQIRTRVAGFIRTPVDHDRSDDDTGDETITFTETGELDVTNSTNSAVIRYALGEISPDLPNAILELTIRNSSNASSNGFLNKTLMIDNDSNDYFVLAPSSNLTEQRFSQFGNYYVDDSGNIRNRYQEVLRAFPVDADGNVTSNLVTDLITATVAATYDIALPTTEIDIGVNLPFRSTPLDIFAFDVNDSNTYNEATSINVIDSLGAEHLVFFYFVNDQSQSNRWAVYMFTDGSPVNITNALVGANGQSYVQLEFLSNGNFVQSFPQTPQSSTISYSNGADDQNLTIDFANQTNTQYDLPFSNYTLEQNGAATRRVNNFIVTPEGILWWLLDDDSLVAVGQLPLASTDNADGLEPIVNSESFSDPNDSFTFGEALNDGFGEIESNVARIPVN